MDEHLESMALICNSFVKRWKLDTEKIEHEILSLRCYCCLQQGYKKKNCPAFYPDTSSATNFSMPAGDEPISEALLTLLVPLIHVEREMGPNPLAPSFKLRLSACSNLGTIDKDIGETNRKNLSPLHLAKYLRNMGKSLYQLPPLYTNDQEIRAGVRQLSKFLDINQLIILLLLKIELTRCMKR